jgi:hypothetical protein
MELTAYIPLFEQGHVVAHLTVHIDPASHAVRFEDKDGKRHASTEERAAEILSDIRQFDRDKWRAAEPRMEGIDMTQSVFTLSRRLFLSKAAQHAPAAAALAVLPVALSPELAQADPIKECERLAAELAEAMNRVRPGRYKAKIDHEYGFALIHDLDFRGNPQGHVPADDMQPRFKEVRELVDKLEHEGYEPRLLHGDLCITRPDGAHKPNRLLRKLRACEPELVAEYLTITGRTTLPEDPEA